MRYESDILKRLVNTYGVVGNPRYISEIIKEFIVRGKERFPELFTYQADWLAHIDEFGLNPSYTVSYTGQSIYAPNTLERPVKSAILKGCTGYRDIDTGEILETFEEGRNLELVSVKMPVLTTSNTVELLKSNNFPLIGIGSSNKHSFLLSKTVDVITLFANLKTVSAYNPGANISFIFKLDDVVKKTVYQKLTPLGITSDIKIIVTGISFNLVEIMLPPATTLDINTMNVFHGEFNEKPLIKSNILTVNDDVKLRGGVYVNGELKKDILDLISGEYSISVGETVLNGSENWEVWYHTDTLLRFMLNYSDMSNLTNIKLKCDKIPSYGYNQNVEGIYGNGGRIYLIIDNSGNKLLGNTVNDLKTYLSQNPITVQYPLKEKSIKTVDLTILDQNGQNVKQLMSFNGGTHFNTGSLEGSLLPSVSVSVETDLVETLKVCSIEGNTM